MRGFYAFKLSSIFDEAVAIGPDDGVYLYFNMSSRKIAEIYVENSESMSWVVHINNYTNVTTFDDHTFELNTSCERRASKYGDSLIASKIGKALNDFGRIFSNIVR